MKCPCHGCKPPKRHPACSGKCPDYAKWKAEELKKKRAIRMAKANDSMVTEYVIKQMRAQKREKNMSEHRADRHRD